MYSHIQILSQAYGQNEWREDLKRVLRCAGGDNQKTVFLFSDTDIVHESFLEDLNGILNTGEVPNLWTVEDLGEISEAVENDLTTAGGNAGNPTEVGGCCCVFYMYIHLLSIHIYIYIYSDIETDIFRY